MKKIIISLVLLTSLTCGKKNNNLKKETGKYLHCKIDGIDYFPEQDQTAWSNKALQASLSSDNLNFTFDTYNLSDKSIGVGITDINSIQSRKYKLSNNMNTFEGAGYFDITPLGSGRFETDSVNSGICTIINIDYSKKLIEGTFSFKCYNNLTSKTANITDGEFSIFFNQ